MDFQQLIDKAKGGKLTSEEQKELLIKFNERMLVLKEKEPEKYLELVTQLNGILKDLTQDLKKIVE
ncbi:MAG: hypothetical protein AAB482_02460 [Patescibacteria group bacterium]